MTRTPEQWLELLKQSGGAAQIEKDGNFMVVIGCARCGHINDGTKRNRRFFAMVEYPDGSICGCCVGKVRKGAKAS